MMRGFLLLGISAFSILIGPAPQAIAQVLHAFGEPSSIDGTHPYSGLVMDASGALYGTTDSGGIANKGTVYKLSPPPAGQSAWTETVIYNFSGGLDGAYPIDDLARDVGGVLYGVARYGGDGLSGAVFKLSPPAAGQSAWTEQVLYSFAANGRGGFVPMAGVILDKAGSLFGTTSAGGAPCSDSGTGCGTVFKLSPPAVGQTGWTHTVLHDFLGGPDGLASHGHLLLDRAGQLYGTTRYGGSASPPCTTIGCGTIFRLTPPSAGRSGWTQTVLHAFAGGTDGEIPYGGVVMDHAGALYGTTSMGGITTGFCAAYGGCGTAFQLAPPVAGQTVWQPTTLHMFQGADGIRPMAGLAIDGHGSLYGSTQYGGPYSAHWGTSNGCGTLFRLSPPPPAQASWTDTSLVSSPAQADYCSLGAEPSTDLLLGGDGTLYGTAAMAGPVIDGHEYRDGTVFRVGASAPK